MKNFEHLEEETSDETLGRRIARKVGAVALATTIVASTFGAMYLGVDALNDATGRNTPEMEQIYDRYKDISVSDLKMDIKTNADELLKQDFSGNKIHLGVRGYIEKVDPATLSEIQLSYNIYFRTVMPGSESVVYPTYKLMESNEKDAPYIIAIDRARNGTVFREYSNVDKAGKSEIILQGELAQEGDLTYIDITGYEPAPQS